MIAPARTGKVNRRRITVIMMAQTNKGIRSSCMPFHRMLITVVIKLIAPKIDAAPAKCSEKIAKSTDGPECARLLERGGYTVHPVPAPFSTAADDTKRISEGGSNQNLRLFRRGNAISGAPSINGRSQLPKPPINTGITIKKIIRNPWAVTSVLYSWSLPKNDPGWDSSSRINKLVPVPTMPAQSPNRIYRVPISLWFVE